LRDIYHYFWVGKFWAVKKQKKYFNPLVANSILKIIMFFLENKIFLHRWLKPTANNF